jgi:hypothetical protein
MLNALPIEIGVSSKINEETSMARNFDEEFWYQVNNKLCGGEFCINPDCYCDEYPRDVIERAAKRLFAGSQIVEPGIHSLDSWRQRVAEDPEEFVAEEDHLRCEYFAEAGQHYDENGEPTCNDPVTKAIFVPEDVDCDGVLYSCDVHASEFAQEYPVIKVEPLRLLPATDQGVN